MKQTNATSELAVLFADIGGSTELYQRVGDTAAHQLIKHCLSVMRQTVEHAGGKLLRTVGDAVLASFEDCNNAFDAARATQETLYNHPLSVRVGFHWGEVIPDQGDVYGNTVNIAARVSTLANTGEIVVTEAVVSRLTPSNKANSHLLDRLTLKGIPKPLAIYRLQWRKEETEQVTQIYTIPLTHDDDYKLSLTCGDQQLSLTEDGEKLTLGRGDSNSIHTAHNAASRVHATVERKSGKFVMTDCSTNGTYVSKHGGPPVFVHRDTITLDGMGVITVGFTPNDLPASKPGTVTFAALVKRD